MTNADQFRGTFTALITPFTRAGAIDFESFDRLLTDQIAAGTGYVPYTMLVIPLRQGTRVVGALSVLDRRDGNPYTTDDIARGDLFAELAVTALGIEPEQYDTALPGEQAAPTPVADEGPSVADQGTVVG